MGQQPNLLNARTESWGSTPLHQAILQNDEKLVRVMLNAGADPTITDETFQADAKGWANHFGLSALAGMIELHQACLPRAVSRQ